MGKHFGNLARYRNVVMRTLSPFEQRAFAGYFSEGMPNLWRRFKESVFRVVPPLVLTYYVYSYGNSLHADLERKDPADFADDE
ncbi:cytochrome b-c1 complex subunit 8-like [Amphiura filiformis]|uniref:cytochrome b-c1 complex subunit 8-like n=1 Tax=Amphiura filiformis TaxID=82378 RepID=UPI003B21C3BF